MLKLLFVVVGLWLIFTILRHYFNNVNSSAKPKDKAAEDMVECAYCKTHIPKSDSLLSNGRRYCCEAHIKEDSA